MNKLGNIPAIDICYVISHGFAARMVLQTGLIHKLTLVGKKVAIISPDANDANFEAFKNNSSVFIFNSPIQQTIWDDDYGFKRPYYLEDIKSNPVFWEKHIYSIFYSKSKHPWKRIRPFYYYLIYQLIKVFPGIRKRFIRNEHHHLESKKVDALVAEINPELMVSTYPINFMEAKFLYAAKKKGLKTLIHLLSWDNITSKGIFPVIPDHFIAWGPVMQSELKEYYKVTDDQIQVCGVAHFDQHFEVKQAPNYAPILEGLKLNPQKPYLFVAMSAPRFAPHEIDIVEWLAAAINENKFGPDLQMIVRPHPQNVQGNFSNSTWIKRLDQLNGNRVAIDYPQLTNSKVRWSMKKEDMAHLSNLLAGCSLCLNSGSTVSIDALQFDKPVLITAFDGDRSLYYWKSARRLIDYPHQKKFIALGGAEVVTSYAALSVAINKYLENSKVDKQQRDYALSMECHAVDGQSTKRVVEALMAVLKSEAVVSHE